MDTSTLRDVQRRVLEAVESYLEEHNRPPTIREIMHLAQLKSTSHVEYHLDCLEEKGFIRRRVGAWRGIEMAFGHRSPGHSPIVNVPIQGFIAAGRPIQAAQRPEDLLLTRDMARLGDYALRVKGDSMIDDHIEDGDIVIVQRQDSADNGDTVVALLLDGPDDTTGEVTLKQFFREPISPDAAPRIRLQPRNAAMRPIYCDPDEVRIQGKVVAVWRNM